MAVGHNVFHRFAGFPDGKSSTHGTGGLTVSKLKIGVHHDDAVARLIGVCATPACKTQYAEHGKNQSYNQQNYGCDLLPWCFFCFHLFFFSFTVIFQYDCRIVILTRLACRQDLLFQLVAAYLWRQRHSFPDLL